MRVGKLGKGASWIVDTTKGAVEKTGEGLKGAYEKTGEGLRTVGAQAGELTSKATSGISDATSNIGATFGGASADAEEQTGAQAQGQALYSQPIHGLPTPQPVGRAGSKRGAESREELEEEDPDYEHRRETLYTKGQGQPYLGNYMDAYIGRTMLAVTDNKWLNWLKPYNKA